MTTSEGIIMDDGVTARIGEDLYYMTTTSSGANGVYQWMQWWLQSGWDFDVIVENATEYRAAMNLAGPRSRQVLEQLVGEVDLSAEAFPYMSCRQLQIAGIPCLLLRIGFTGELSFEIHAPSGYSLQLWQAIMEAGEPFGILPFGIEAQRVLRLEKGHLIVGQDSDSLTDPIEAGMAWAVKLDKPDFLGRAFLDQSSGETNRRLVGFTVAEGRVPAEASQIVKKEPGAASSEIIGRVTSSRWSPTLEMVIGLAWLPENMAKANTPFLIQAGHDQIQARVHSLPFYDPPNSRLKA
jgi:sarcosine oxidase subunit alpha